MATDMGLGLSTVLRHPAPISAALSPASSNRSAALPSTQATESVKTSGQNNRMEDADLSELQAVDRRVRAHERAHSSVGGRYTGPPQFTYERGSNGVNYAVAGEVEIDTSEVPGDPEATVEKMRIVQAAALAPIDPSPQDRAVAATARSTEIAARYELLQQLDETGEADPASGARINLQA